MARFDKWPVVIKSSNKDSLKGAQKVEFITLDRMGFCNIIILKINKLFIFKFEYCNTKKGA